MPFEDLVGEFNNHNQKELVGLSIYYFEEYDGKYKVITPEIRNLFSGYGITINNGSIATRIRELVEDGLVEEIGTGSYGPKPVSQYKLTRLGTRYFKNLAIDREDEVRQDNFINLDKIEEDYYEQLVTDINKSYKYGINDGVLVLTRKLFENFIIDILRAEYGGQGIDLYYNTEVGQFHGLGTLCGKFDAKSSDLDHYSRHLDNNLVDRIRPFKEHGNSRAHSVRVKFSDDELEDMSTEATELTKILYEIRNEVRIANG